jgi:PAS domain S-box-containing protein
MSDPADRRRGTPAEPGWALPIADWQKVITDARARTASLRAARGVPERSEGELVALRELSLTYEELSVAEEELRAQNEELQRARVIVDDERSHYRQLFFQAPVPYLVTDQNGVLIEANQAASDLLHCRPDRLVGKPIVVFTQDTSRRLCRTLVRRLNAGEHEANARLRLTPRAGRLVPVEATVSAARGLHGDLLEIRWLLVDLRPRRRREVARRRRALELERLVTIRTQELERAQKLKDRLVATVSHELRTPLAAITGYAELLTMGLRGQLNDAQSEDIRRIQRAAEHLAYIVEDLLDYSRLAAQSLTFDIHDVPLAESLRGVVELVSPQAREADVALEVAIAPTLDAIRADPERLRQIVLNLLGNAVKFTPPGGTVRLRTSVIGAQAMVEVEDTGPGIPVNERESVFEPFVRLRPDRTVPGTGLGLAISRDMALAMGGNLFVKDAPGGGSCFVLRLQCSIPLAEP